MLHSGKSLSIIYFHLLMPFIIKGVEIKSGDDPTGRGFRLHDTYCTMTPPLGLERNLAGLYHKRHDAKHHPPVHSPHGSVKPGRFVTRIDQAVSALRLHPRFSLAHSQFDWSLLRPGASTNSGFPFLSGVLLGPRDRKCRVVGP